MSREGSFISPETSQADDGKGGRKERSAGKRRSARELAVTLHQLRQHHVTRKHEWRAEREELMERVEKARKDGQVMISFRDVLRELRRELDDKMKNLEETAVDDTMTQQFEENPMTQQSRNLPTANYGLHNPMTQQSRNFEAEMRKLQEEREAEKADWMLERKVLMQQISTLRSAVRHQHPSPLHVTSSDDRAMTSSGSHDTQQQSSTRSAVIKSSSQSPRSFNVLNRVQKTVDEMLEQLDKMCEEFESAEEASGARRSTSQSRDREVTRTTGDVQSTSGKTPQTDFRIDTSKDLENVGATAASQSSTAQILPRDSQPAASCKPRWDERTIDVAAEATQFNNISSTEHRRAGHPIDENISSVTNRSKPSRDNTEVTSSSPTSCSLPPYTESGTDTTSFTSPLPPLNIISSSSVAQTHRPAKVDSYVSAHKSPIAASPFATSSPCTSLPKLHQQLLICKDMPSIKKDPTRKLNTLLPASQTSEGQRHLLNPIRDKTKCSTHTDSAALLSSCNPSHATMPTTNYGNGRLRTKSRSVADLSSLFIAKSDHQPRQIFPPNPSVDFVRNGMQPSVHSGSQQAPNSSHPWKSHSGRRVGAGKVLNNDGEVNNMHPLTQFNDKGIKETTDKPDKHDLKYGGKFGWIKKRFQFFDSAPGHEFTSEVVGNRRPKHQLRSEREQKVARERLSSDDPDDQLRPSSQKQRKGKRRVKKTEPRRYTRSNTDASGIVFPVLGTSPNSMFEPETVQRSAETPGQRRVASQQRCAQGDWLAVEQWCVENDTFKMTNTSDTDRSEGKIPNCRNNYIQRFELSTDVNRQTTDYIHSVGDTPGRRTSKSQPHPSSSPSKPPGRSLVSNFAEGKTIGICKGVSRDLSRHDNDFVDDKTTSTTDTTQTASHAQVIAAGDGNKKVMRNGIAAKAANLERVLSKRTGPRRYARSKTQPNVCDASEDSSDNDDDSVREGGASIRKGKEEVHSPLGEPRATSNLQRYTSMPHEDFTQELCPTVTSQFQKPSMFCRRKPSRWRFTQPA